MDHEHNYNEHVRALRDRIGDEDRAMEQAIGGEFEAVGLMELDLLVAHGLGADDYLVDVGCGSGRLAAPLAAFLRGPYLGTDVVEDLLVHARRLAGRPDWRFEIAPGLAIPEVDGAVDMVCAFSLFTHLLHEETFRYLEEARRVLRPGGKIVFSFLEFSVGSHWAVFESNLAAIGTAQHLNQFMDRDGIQVWAQHLGLGIEGIFPGDIPFIPLSAPVQMEGGQRFERAGTFGQSVAILRKPQEVAASGDLASPAVAVTEPAAGRRRFRRGVR